MPRDIKEAYKRDERSRDGRPGKNYWQNTGRYKISVTVDPARKTISGSEEITYINNSPVELTYLNYRLFQNIHKPGAQRNYDADPAYLTDGIQIDSFDINGQKQVWREPVSNFTYKWVTLPKPLASKDSVKIFFKWHYTISSKATREGMIDSTTAFLAYFYPRVAVVDDYNWWDWMDFTDLQEFYNDFNDYVLHITVPKNYIVWSTGTLQNASEVLQPEFADRLARSFVSDSVIKIASLKELVEKKVTRQNDANTWKWIASDVPDVAFGVSDHFAWDGSSVVVDKLKPRVSVQALYNDTALHFHSAVSIARHALEWFSKKWPGIPYPYPKMTISSGADDMEYPMMVNDIPDTNLKAAALVEKHEIAHTWFPFYMGINESRYGFMDEGWATAFEYLINREDEGIKAADSVFKEARVKPWISDPTSTQDLPIITPMDVTRGVSYGNNAYGKAALAYLALKDLLGDSLFRKCLHAFIDRWHGRHPIPWDFFYTFNDVAKKNLDWFWANWFFANGYNDVGITNVIKTTTGYKITINNTGGYYIPFDLHVNYSDGSKTVMHYTPQVWQKNKQPVIVLNTVKKIKSVEVNAGIFMEDREVDNVWPAAK